MTCCKCHADCQLCDLFCSLIPMFFRTFCHFFLSCNPYDVTGWACLSSSTCHLIGIILNDDIQLLNLIKCSTETWPLHCRHRKELLLLCLSSNKVVFNQNANSLLCIDEIRQKQYDSTPKKPVAFNFSHESFCFIIYEFLLHISCIICWIWFLKSNKMQASTFLDASPRTRSYLMCFIEHKS